MAIEDKEIFFSLHSRTSHIFYIIHTDVLLTVFFSWMDRCVLSPFNTQTLITIW